MNKNIIRFLYFYYADWGDDEVVTLSGINEMFDMDIRHVMYYLKWLVREKLVCKVTTKHHTYYVKRWCFEHFEQLSNVHTM